MKATLLLLFIASANSQQFSVSERCRNPCSITYCPPGTFCENRNRLFCILRPRRCCAIAVCRTGTVQTSKPGTCRRPQGGHCMNECDVDTDCPGRQKCCSNGCGRTCQFPRTITRTGRKPGRCPPIPSGPPLLPLTGPDMLESSCMERCFSDFDCEGRDKCCGNPCGHECKKPV